jgi:hypothetical protein
MATSGWRYSRRFRAARVNPLLSDMVKPAFIMNSG